MLMILPSVCVFLLTLLGNGSVKSFRGNEYALNNRMTVGHGVFCAVRVGSNAHYVVTKIGSKLFPEHPVLVLCRSIRGGKSWTIVVTYRLLSFPRTSTHSVFVSFRLFTWHRLLRFYSVYSSHEKTCPFVFRDMPSLRHVRALKVCDVVYRYSYSVPGHYPSSCKKGKVVHMLK
jgi:hypothetical protein